MSLAPIPCSRPSFSATMTCFGHLNRTDGGVVYRDTLKNYGGADVGSISQRDGFSLAEPKTSPKLGARILARGMGSNPILFTFLLRANGVSSRQVGDALFARKTAAPIYYAKTHTTQQTPHPSSITIWSVGRSALLLGIGVALSTSLSGVRPFQLHPSIHSCAERTRLGKRRYVP